MLASRRWQLEPYWTSVRQLRVIEEGGEFGTFCRLIDAPQEL